MNQINNLAGRHSSLENMAGPKLFSENPRLAIGRAALLIFVLYAFGCGEKEQEKVPKAPVPPATQSGPPAPETPPVPKPEAKPLTTPESLVAPIALYPDPLLAEVLVAATYPLEVVQAARWLESKPDPATVREKNWDASIVRLTAVPEVIAMMDRHLDWTTQLGDAFLSNPTQLMDAVQTLRKRAVDSGFLKDSDLQKVETQTVSQPEAGQDESRAAGVKATPAVLTREVITIKPAKSDTLSVPSYNPEVVYSAPMASPPATTQMYPTGTMAAVPATTSYYPTYVPPATTTTTTSTSSTDPWLSFGAGAVVGGLLTWGIMEWADDDDDWDDGYHVSHYYGNAVCHGGNCWHGGGGGYYGGGRYGNTNVNRGNINVDRDVNISGNEINFNRDGTFSPDQLPALKDRTNQWQPDPRHRRGQDYPPQARQRMGRAETSALAGGSRLSGAENLPAGMRGFDQTAGERRAPARLSSADVQQRLAAKPAKDMRPGKVDSRDRPVSSRRENALEGLRTSGQRNNLDSRRGASSLDSRQQRAGQPRAKDQAGLGNRRSETAAPSQRRPQQAVQRPVNQQKLARQQNEQAQRLQSQRRQERSKPTAFDSARDGGRSNAYSSRGNASFKQASTSFARPQSAARQSPSAGRQQAPRRGGASRGGAAGGGRGGGRR